MPRHIEELINRQIRTSEMAHRKAEENGLPSVKPVVTISRTMGSGARIIAHKLAEDLGWSLWGRELLDEMARDARVSRGVVEAFDEKTRSEVEVLIRDLLGDHELGSFLYAKHLIAAVAGIARLGNAVILGRGANFILPHALNVRIDAPLELRIRNMITYEHLSEEEARKKVLASDRERSRFLERTFGRDVARRCLYSLSICTGTFTNDQAVEIIEQGIALKYGLPTPRHGRSADLV